MPAPTPPLLPQPFANNAAGGDVNVIPDTTATPGRASYDLGFPPATMQPVIAGGIPPLGQDVNGILKELSSHIFSLQAGQLYPYNSSVSAAIGGYALGAILGMADGSGAWLNLVADNTSDPDAGGAGWASAVSYGQTALAVTGGSATLTPAESRRSLIVVSGALVSNQTLIFPTTIERWLIVNATSGAFTLTVKTAAGTGVVVAQGGFAAPIEVYGDGTNLYAAVSPTVLPTDVAPTSNTIPLRDSVGRLFATYLNQNSALENFAISAVIAQTGADGFNRKISLTNFAAQAFPTAAVGTNTSQLATTAFSSAQGVGGAGQTYQNLTASRFASTLYTNTTGRPILVVISIGLASGGSSCTAIVDGLGVGGVVASGANTQFMLSFIVPAGSGYLISPSGSVTALVWAELR